jgi:hypothetical protein
MARAAAWLTLCWLLLGLHCYLLVLGYGANSWRALPLALVSRSGLLLVEESSLLHGGAQVGGLAAKEPVGRRTDSE